MKPIPCHVRYCHCLRTLRHSDPRWEPSLWHRLLFQLLYEQALLLIRAFKIEPRLSLLLVASSSWSGSTKNLNGTKRWITKWWRNLLKQQKSLKMFLQQFFIFFSWNGGLTDLLISRKRLACESSAAHEAEVTLSKSNGILRLNFALTTTRSAEVRVCPSWMPSIQA